MDTAYIETTVVGNVAGRLHPDPLIAARQTVTRQWWATAARAYRLLASELVIEECGAGDPTAAAERLAAIEGVELLDTSDAVERLAAALLQNGAVAASHPRDAFHMYVAPTGSSRPSSAHLNSYWRLNVIPSPTEEIRAIRRELAARFGNDLHRIAEETRRRQRDSGREYISLPKRPPQAHDTTNHAIHRSGGDDAMGSPESSSAAR